MLSFMKEQGLEDKLANSNTGKTSKSGSSATDPKKTAKNGQNAEEQEYLTVAARKQKVKNSTLLLIALFVAGLLGILLMIKKSSPQIANAQIPNRDNEQIETAISKLTDVRLEIFESIDRIVKKFYEFSDVKQIKVDELVKNPFENEALLAGLCQIPDKSISPDVEQQMTNEQLLQQKNMQLLCIMKSEVGNSCMINDKILYEGDIFSGLYVSQIGDDFVKLEPKLKYGQTDKVKTQNQQIVLKLSE